MQSSRKPRLVVTGEFSAGKTKLINGLVGKEVLPSNVVSTSLPPIWLVAGEDASYRIDLKGEAHRIENLDDVSVEDTLACLRIVNADVLNHIDIIDTPGNSDPNIPAESWERMIGYADMLIWCTGATQAWRQSEKSTVRDLPDELLRNGTLLITQADRITDENSAKKLKRRVTRDAEQFFDAILMASLIDDSDVKMLKKHVIDQSGSLDGQVGREFEVIEALRPKAKTVASPWRLEAALEAGKQNDTEAEAKQDVPASAMSEADQPKPDEKPKKKPDVQSAKPEGKSKPKAKVAAPAETSEAEAEKAVAIAAKSTSAELPSEVVSIAPKSDEARKAPSSVKALWHIFADGRELKDPADIRAAFESFLDGIDKIYRLSPIDEPEPLKLTQSNRIRSSRRPSQRREISVRN